MKFDELMSKILEIMPNATLDEDNYGQIIVYTDLEETPNGQLRKFVEPSEDDLCSCHCDCGRAHTEDDMAGGRCLGCGIMICSELPKDN